MLGAITGDVVGSRFEGQREVEPEFLFFTSESRFTDDTVLTCAVAEAILEEASYQDKLRAFARDYPGAGFGARFKDWAYSDGAPAYGSKGNGSAMRVSPVGWAFDNLDDVLLQAELSSAPTHNHPDGLAAAQAVAGAIFLARTGRSKDEIRALAGGRFGYRLDFDMEQARLMGSSVLAPNSVPQALTAFLHAEYFDQAVALAVSIGGDTDTVAAIAGSVAEAFFGGVPEHMASQVYQRLDDRLAGLARRFQAEFGPE
jgi:ADP-ribosylglycohydrolase